MSSAAKNQLADSDLMNIISIKDAEVIELVTNEPGTLRMIAAELLLNRLSNNHLAGSIRSTESSKQFLENMIAVGTNQTSDLMKIAMVVTAELGKMIEFEIEVSREEENDINGDGVYYVAEEEKPN